MQECNARCDKAVGVAEEARAENRRDESPSSVLLPKRHSLPPRRNIEK